MKKPARLYRDKPQDRRRIAAGYRKLASGRRFTLAERVEFGRMAYAWASTLPKDSHTLTVDER